MTGWRDPDPAETSVQRGARLLDERAPGWWEDIDTDDLNMWDFAWCVLGQVFGHFRDGLYEIGASNDDAGYYRFELNSEEESWDTLCDEWRVEIAGRRRMAEKEQPRR